eukprot:TRINITY_DN1704_c0_g1_i2.p1 TRINITY_DN1704_c0_g1~~TRINITY_DN1704_c0_g1_i2.p1  ORF type:complete len:1532 (-),score=208.78 TRINITY_DN1704_c0_g1_i2:397-4689(-)
MKHPQGGAAGAAGVAGAGKSAAPAKQQGKSSSGNKPIKKSTTDNGNATTIHESTEQSMTGERGSVWDLSHLLVTVLLYPYIFTIWFTALMVLTLAYVPHIEDWTTSGIISATSFFFTEAGKYIILPALPFVILSYLGESSRALAVLSVCGVANVVYMGLHYFYDCMSCSLWSDNFSTTGTKLFFFNTTAMQIVFTTFLLVETWRQCGRLKLWPYILLALSLFGVEVAIPLFFISLQRYEQKRITKPALAARIGQRRAGNTVVLLYVVEALLILAVITPLAYTWTVEPGNLASKIYQIANTRSALRMAISLALFFAAGTCYALPQIGDSWTPSTWYYRLILALIMALNPAFGMAIFLCYRELTPNKTFVEPNTNEDESDNRLLGVIFAGAAGLFIRFVLFSAIGYASSRIGWQGATVLFFIDFALEFLLNYGYWNYEANLKLLHWMQSNYFTAFFDFVVGVLMLLVSWGDAAFMPVTIRTFLISSQTYIWDASLLLGIVAGIHMIWKGLTYSGSPLPILLKVFMFLALGFLLFAKYESMESSCPLTVGREYMHPSPEFERDFARAIKDMVRDSASKSSEARRLQHHKAHGCVIADFSINKLIPPQLRQGLFSKKYSTYKAIVRFSNGAGSDQSDSAYDVRAMSIKLLGVNGDFVLNAEEPGFENGTQDFILLSSDTFFTNAHEMDSYLSMVQANQDGSMSLLKWIFHGLNPFGWRLAAPLRILKLVLEAQGVNNPLNWQYYSTTPYRLGSGRRTAVKYSARPCFGTISKQRKVDDVQRRDQDPDHFLRGNMYSTLQAQDVCFDFLVQTQTDACRQPIEDPTVSWPGGWAKVATITIPQQQFLYRSQIDYCRSLSFNPWHSLVEHKPLGLVNYARKPAYASGASTRRKYNNESEAAPSLEQFMNTSVGPVVVDGLHGAGNTIDYNYARYAYPFHLLPKHIQRMPADQEFDGESYNRMVSWYLKTQFNFMANDKDGNVKHFGHFEDPDDYKNMFGSKAWLLEPLAAPSISKRWRLEIEFARQYITGVNPIMIRAVRAEDPLPDALNLSPTNLALINQKLYEAAPASNATLDSLRDENRLFYVDYSILDDIYMKDDRVFYSPIIVLYLDHTKNLMPLLIQLTQDPSDDCEVFVAPNEIDGKKLWYTDGTSNYSDDVLARTWLFARMHVMAADGIVHEMVSHLAFTHLAMEPIVIGFHRQLAVDHKIFQLMFPHFRNTLAINNFGRSTLLSDKDSVFDRIMGCGLVGSLALMQKAYTTRFSLMDRAFDKEMAARGFYEVTSAEDDNLPGYYYRDDGYKLWNAIKKYVTIVVHHPDVYGNDQWTDSRIQRDDQLQALKRELADPEMGNVPGIPELETADDLIDFLTTIVFTCTAQHSAVNFGQFDYYSFVPNRPLQLTKPMPDDKNQVTNAYIMAALPSKDVTSYVIFLCVGGGGA